MTVAVNVNTIIKLPRVTPGLPAGVEVFSMFGTVTAGAGGGNTDTIFGFNPGSGRTFQPYVCVTRLSVHVGVADPTDGTIFPLPSSWERSFQSGVIGSPVLRTLNTELANGEYHVTLRENIMLGRVQLGSPGALYVRFPEVDTAVHYTYLEGLISDVPFFIPGDISV